VPKTIDAETAIHVGEPKLRFPASEKAWPFSFLSFVHRTTSHGGEGVSISPGSSTIWLLNDSRRLAVRNAGEAALGDSGDGDDIRDENRRSNGLNEGVGLLRPGREATEGSTLLLGEERIEPCRASVSCLLPFSMVEHGRLLPG
jgi:hypothetical protein